MKFKVRLISMLTLFVLCFNFVFSSFAFAGSLSNQDEIDIQSTEKLEYERLSKEIENYFDVVNGKMTINTTKMEHNGYSDFVIRNVEQQYKEIDANLKDDSINHEKIISRAPAKFVIKSAAKWLKKNWAKVYKKLPKPVKRYMGINTVTKYIDAYVNFSDTINEFLTKVVNACLPSFLEWMTPAIVATIELILPF